MRAVYPDSARSIATALLLGGAACAQFSTTRVSTFANGTQSPRGGNGGVPTADGRFVVFSTQSSLVPQDTRPLSTDVYLRDRTRNTLELLSVDPVGRPGNGGSVFRDISAQGRFVLFTSDASNLGGDDQKWSWDLFVRDVAARTTVRASVGIGGNEANGHSRNGAISTDGRYIAFESVATNLVSGDTNGFRDIFWRDLQRGITRRVSVNSSSAQANAECDYPGISGDGRYVVFHSRATNLGVGDTNGNSDVFLHDTRTGVTRIVSRSSAGTLGSGFSAEPAISADGRMIAFRSSATNLIPNKTNRWSDIFVHDRITGATSRASVRTGGLQANHNCLAPSLSGDGRFVAFHSAASSLVRGDTNGLPDILVRDRLARTTSRVSVASTGAQASGGGRHGCNSARISDDGQVVVYASTFDNLVTGDTNGHFDVFLSGTPLPREIVDGASSTKNVSLFVDRDRITTDVARLHAGGDDRSGITADGVSRVLVRVLTGREGTLKVALDANLGAGALALPGGVYSNAQLTVPIVATPRGRMGIFVYRAPLDFVRAGVASDLGATSRSIGLRYEFTANGSPSALQVEDRIEIYRPPVAFSHGLWSSKGTWKNEFGRLANGGDPRFTTLNVDYARASALSFIVNARRVSDAVDRLLTLYRFRDIACSQVDWVGHSMGGVLPRFELFLSNSARARFPWWRPDNYMAGNLHKLIIVNSPQWGSPFGNLVASIRDSGASGEYFSLALTALGMPPGGAIDDLSEGSSGYRAIGVSPIRAHAIVGVGPEKLLGAASTVLSFSARKIAGPVGALVITIATYRNPPQNLIYRGHRHDLIVLEPSQRGGLPAQFVTEVKALVSAIHTQITGYGVAHDKAVELLNAPMTRFSPNMPAPNLNPPLNAGGGALSAPLVDHIEITNPNQVRFVEPGKTVVLGLAGKQGFVPVKADLLTATGHQQASGAPLRFTASIPQDASGKVAFVALAEDAQQRIAGALPFSLPVKIAAKMTALAASDERVVLYEPMQTYALGVVAEFDDQASRAVHTALAGQCR